MQEHGVSRGNDKKKSSCKAEGEEAKELVDGYKLFYAGKNKTRNRVCIVLDKDLKEKNSRGKEIW